MKWVGIFLLLVLIAVLVFFPRKKEKPAPTPVAVSACASFYRRLHAHDILKILIAFGYKDARPRRFVGDRYESNNLIHILTGPCVSGNAACGFSRDPGDSELFRKGRVELRLTHSSIGPDDEENRRDPYQARQSSSNAANFSTAFQEYDVVFYNGHSRDGGGPDFSPPKLTKDGHTDYSFYRRNRPGSKALGIALAAPDRRAQVFGIFSCSSSKHFSDEIHRKAPNLSTITTDRMLFYSDATDRLRIALSAIISERCPSKQVDTPFPEMKDTRWRWFFDR